MVRNGISERTHKRRPGVDTGATAPLIGTVPETLYQCLIPRHGERPCRSKRLCRCLPRASPTMIYAGLEKPFGELPAGFSSASITRMAQAWLEEHRSWNRRDMSLSRYCYIWVDGIHFNLRLDEGRLCVLTLMGATEDGRKELVAVAGGYRESAESWLEVLRDLKERGMPSPKLCIGDGALGFWKAIRQVYPAADHQRCWVHKTANVLDKLP